jgi:hypothetical protein
LKSKKKFVSSLLLLLSGLTTAAAFQNCSKFSAVDPDSKAYVEIVSSINSISLAPKGSSAPLLSANSYSGADLINFGFHMGGGTADGRPLVEEYLFADQPRSSWYIAQWKKISPLRPSTDLKLDTNGRLFEVAKSTNTESSVRALLGANNQVIYEIETNQGYSTSVGGSNILIASDVQKPELASFDREIVLNFNTKVLEKTAVVKPQYKAQEAQLLAGAVTGFFVGGFPITFDDGNPDHLTSLYIQYEIADTRINNPSQLFSYRGFYPHGKSMEIVATIPVNELTGNLSDFKFAASSKTAPLEKITINLNKLLCVTLKGDFNRTDGLAQEKKNFYDYNGGMYVKNLSKWRVGSMYLGFESQAVAFDEATQSSLYFYSSSDPRYVNHDVRDDIKARMPDLHKGTTKLVVQIADLNLKAAADPYVPLNTCDDVFAAFPTTSQVNLIDPAPAPTPVPAAVCTANSATTTGCTQPANGLAQRTCTSQGNAYGACVISCSTGFHSEGSTCVRDVTLQHQCTSGAFINSQTNEANEYMCNCTAADPITKKAGWYAVGSSCAHRVAGFFSDYRKTKIYWVCDLKTTPQNAVGKNPWLQQQATPNCYHWDSKVPTTF